jgi:hypothetical protein
MTYHVYLLDLACLWDSNAAIYNVNDLLDPRAVATQVVQDVPIVGYSSCSLLMFGGRAMAALRMPPTAPARVVGFAGALVLEVARVEALGGGRTCLRT